MTTSPDDARALAKQMLAGMPTIPYYSTSLATKHRGKFVAAAWTLGASWAQLGGLFNIRRESVMNQANKWLPPHKRKNLARVMISFQRLSELQQAWIELCRSRPDFIEPTSIPVLAQLLDQLAVDDSATNDPRAVANSP